MQGDDTAFNQTNEAALPVVLAVAPPGSEDVLDAPTFLGRMPNVGILYLASALERAGYPSVALDRHYDSCSPFEFAAEILSHEPRLIGFTLFDLTMEFTKQALEIIRRLYDGPIVVGGYTATFHADDILREWPEVDFILLHEAEDSLVALMRYLDGSGPIESIANLCWRGEDGVKRTGAGRLVDVTATPWPKRYWQETQDVTPIITRRGCTSRCTFCAMVPFYDREQGPVVRYRDVINVVDEIEACIENGRTELMFYDDDFGLATERDRSWADQFAEEVVRRGLRFQFGIELRVIDVVRGQQQLASLGAAGLSHMAVGMESLLPRQLELFRKGYKQADVYKAIEILRHTSIYYQTNVIFWDPWTTLAEASEHLRLLDEIDFQDQLATANYPFYAATLSARQGTAVHTLLTEQGLLQRSARAFYRYDYDFQDPDTGAFHEHCLPDFLDRGRRTITRPPALWMLVPRLRFARHAELAAALQSAGSALARTEFEYFRRYIELAREYGAANPDALPFKALHGEMAVRLAACAAAFPSVPDTVIAEVSAGGLPVGPGRVSAGAP